MNEVDIIEQILSLGPEEIENWLENRLTELEASAEEDREEISTFSYTLRRVGGQKDNTEVHGFIPSHTKLKKMQNDLSSFCVDDNELYLNIINALRSAKLENIQKDGKLNHSNIMAFIQVEIIKYFGMVGIEQRRNLLYDSRNEIDGDKPFSISDFKRNGTAMCVERSAIAQNILAMLGYDPMLIYGYLSSDKGTVNEGHAYNCIIRDGKALVIDFTNPRCKDGKYYRPSIYPISGSHLKEFMKGEGQLETQYKNYHTENGELVEDVTNLVYSSEEIDRRYFDKKKKNVQELGIESVEVQKETSYMDQTEQSLRNHERQISQTHEQNQGFSR